MPLSEMLADFYNQLKSRTQGYASLDYTFEGYRAAPLSRVDILINHQPVEALSMIVHRDLAVVHGRALVEKLRTTIPRQLFEVPIQAAIGSRDYCPGRRCGPFARTCWPSATAGTSPASASCWRSRRKARSE